MKEDQIKHLELIQAIINRMASNSFMLKGWTITLVSGIFLLSSIKNNLVFLVLPILPTLIFWVLDSNYLQQERLFIMLFNHVRCSYQKKENNIDLFSMDTHPFEKDKDSLFKVVISKTELPFYGSLSLVELIIVIYCWIISHQITNSKFF